MKNQVIQTGNSFDQGSFTLGHARKVWRRIEEQLPGTGIIKNLSDFAQAGLVRSGMALAKDTSVGADVQDFVAIPWADIVSAQDVTYSKVDSPTGNPKTKGYYEYDETDGYVATNDTSVTANKDYYEQVAAVTTDGLGIVGFLQEDVPVISHVSGETTTYNTGTCTVIVKGEIYGYMLGDTQEQAATVAAAIKAMAQKNGLNIRVID